MISVLSVVLCQSQEPSLSVTFGLVFFFSSNNFCWCNFVYAVHCSVCISPVSVSEFLFNLSTLSLPPPFVSLNYF